MSEAYWINPQGDIVEVSQQHITEVIQFPQTFGLTKAYIAALHKKYRERIGVEGDARNDIMVRLMDNGWIRLRYVRREDLWIAQVSEKSSFPWKSRMREWAIFLEGKGGYSRSSVQVINLVPDNVGSAHSVMEVAAGAFSDKRRTGLFAEYRNPKKKERRKK